MNNSSFENMDLYLKDIRMCPPLLSAERERELFRILAEETNKRKKQLSRNELIVSNLRLVVWVANGIKKNRYLYSLALEDLISEGNLALAKAVDGYKYSSTGGVKFSSYATIVIRHEIYSKIDEDYTIRIPCSDYYKYDIEYRRMIDKYGDNLTDEIVLAETSIPKGSLSTVKQRVAIKVVSIFKERKFNDGNHETLEDVLMDENAKTAYDVISEYGVLDYIRGYFSCLSKVEKYAIERIYFSAEWVTLEQIGSEIKCTRSRVGQIHFAALKKLRIAIQKDWCKIHNKKFSEKKGTRNMAAYRNLKKYNNDELLHDYEIAPDDNRKILRYFLQGVE